MARIRTIKPEFWTHEDLSALPEATHMLAAALLNHADDEGYFNANPGLVKAACSPLREPSVSIQDSLISLQKVGYLRMFNGTDGKRYGQVITFDDHQRVNRPTPSKIKPLCCTDECAVIDHPQLTEPSPPERKGTGKGREQGMDGASPSGSRLPADWSLPDDWRTWAIAEPRGGELRRLLARQTREGRAQGRLAGDVAELDSKGQRASSAAERCRA
jgi:hypothetical protein